MSERRREETLEERVARLEEELDVLRRAVLGAPIVVQPVVDTRELTPDVSSQLARFRERARPKAAELLRRIRGRE